MNLIFFSHPPFLGSQSMPRYTAKLANGMRKRGHHVEILTPVAKMHNISVSKSAKKWLGYADQFLLFPYQVRQHLQRHSPDTLYIFTDHALGPWVPLINGRPHVVHCHDFLAQRSAKGDILENKTSWSGRQYQAYIRRGYSTAKNFISVSEKTRKDLHGFLPSAPALSEVVYNGLNPLYAPANVTEARYTLSQQTGVDVSGGYLLHVGGNQWYKNRIGVIDIYDAWRTVNNNSLPLLMIGEKPVGLLLERYKQSPYNSSIHFMHGWDDAAVHQAYVGASLFLFPSLAEGFGWPIAEAMASGCPVITTNEAPMTEVAGDAAFLIPRRPSEVSLVYTWALHSASVVEQLIQLPNETRVQVVEAGLLNAKRFSVEGVLQQIESIYQNILLSTSRI